MSYDVYLITNNVEDEKRLLDNITDNDVFLTTYDTTTKTGKKEGFKLKSSVGAKSDPCIVVLMQDVVKKCFYSEASKDVVGDFLNWLNGTQYVMNGTELTVKKMSIDERLNIPITVPIVNMGAQDLPEYADVGSAGMDLRANILESCTLAPMERKLIPTGLHIGLPFGFEAQVRPRSGLALKKGITVLNTPGTIDSSYRGEIGVILINLSNEPFEINPGDRIAQLVVARHSVVKWREVEELNETERGSGGFGHTGV